MSGRPLRFLGGIVALWALGRIAFLLPQTPVVERAVTPARPATPRRVAVAMAGSSRYHQAPNPLQISSLRLASPPPVLRPAPFRPASITPREAPPPDARIAPSPAFVVPPFAPLAAPPQPIPPRRWSASLWAIARDGGQTLLPGGQLGGSQGGVRLLRRLDTRGNLSASLRLSAPWQRIGREMAVGIDWRPVHRLPIRLLVEQRLALDAGQDAPAALVVTGIGPRPVAPGIVLTGYAQAGAVARTRIEPFADGAVRASTPLTPSIDLGLGLWGGAQRDAQRLDAGPTLGVALPVADRRVRLSLDWRQRIAGRAAPGSGPALTLAGDF